MSVLQQVMFVIACATTAVLVMQIVLMLVGGATDGSFDGGDISDIGGGGLSDVGGGGLSDVGDSVDLDMGGSLDFDSDLTSTDGTSDATVGSSSSAQFGFRLLSFRSILAFIVVGAWMCYTLCYALDWYYALMISVVCGFAAACGMAAAIIGLEKLQQSGNIDPQNAVGKIGTVYLTIPPARTGRGKINVLTQERYVEYEAVTDSDEAISTTSEIKVVGNAGGNVLIVERYKKPAIVIETQK